MIGILCNVLKKTGYSNSEYKRKKVGDYLESLKVHYCPSSPKKSLPLRSSFDFLSLIRDWETIVGKQLAQVTIPLKMAGKTLIILSSHPLYSQHLSYMDRAVIKKVTVTFPRLKGKINSMGFQNNESFFRKKKEEQSKIHLREEKPPLARKLHPKSPEYRRLKKEGEKIAETLSEKKPRPLVVSLYMQLETSRLLE